MTPAPYVELLKSEFAKRSQKNPRYSLRAFARDAGLSPSCLSELFKGKYGLSFKHADAIPAKLGWSQKQARYFKTLIHAGQARSEGQRKAAQLELEVIQHEQEFQELREDQLEIFSDWKHFAVLELTYLHDFSPESSWIAERLGLSKTETELMLGRLLRSGMLVREGKSLKASHDFTSTPTDVISKAIRRFHERALERSRQALEEQSIEERDFSGVVMAIDQNDLPEAKKQIQAFRRRFCKDRDQAQRKNSVYLLSIQLVRLDQKKRKEKL